MIPTKYSYRNLIVRWRTTIMTASGFTLVVAALIIMLAFFNGVRTVSAVAGEAQNVIVLSEGRADEVTSRLDHRLAFQAEVTPGVLRDETGELLASRELFMVITPPSDSSLKSTFVQARGVKPVALKVHSKVAVSAGRMFRRNHREAIIGEALARENELRIGDTIPIGRKDWRIVGVFAAGGSTFESEVWCDLNQLAGQFHREGNYTSLVLRTTSPVAAAEVVDHLEDSKLLDVEASTELNYYMAHAEQMNMIRIGAIVIAFFMSVGTVLGVTNTMFAAISQRTKDIAVLRLLGYKQWEILTSFLIEALLIAAFGGLVGSAIGYLINGVSLSAAVGSKQVAFAFTVDSQILLTALGFTFGMGLIGGLLPAFSAMRVRPIEALR